MCPYWMIGNGDGLVSSAVCQHKQHWRPAGGGVGMTEGKSVCS